MCVCVGVGVRCVCVHVCVCVRCVCMCVCVSVVCTMHHGGPSLLKGMTTLTLLPGCSPNTTSMNCTTLDSYALVWSVGKEIRSFLLGKEVGVVHFNITSSGINCTAYKIWVNETSRTIWSYMTCTGLSGLPEPFPILCKSDDDNGGVCSIVLKNSSCAMNASNNSSGKCVYT